MIDWSSASVSSPIACATSAPRDAAPPIPQKLVFSEPLLCFLSSDGHACEELLKSAIDLLRPAECRQLSCVSLFSCNKLHM